MKLFILSVEGAPIWPTVRSWALVVYKIQFDTIYIGWRCPKMAARDRTVQRNYDIQYISEKINQEVCLRKTIHTLVRVFVLIGINEWLKRLTSWETLSPNTQHQRQIPNIIILLFSMRRNQSSKESRQEYTAPPRGQYEEIRIWEHFSVTGSLLDT